MKAATHIELVRAGYRFLGRRMCTLCGEEVLFFMTPKRRRAPFVLLSSGKYLSHFATCVEPQRGKTEEGGRAKCEQMKLI